MLTLSAFLIMSILSKNSFDYILGNFGKLGNFFYHQLITLTVSLIFGTKFNLGIKILCQVSNESKNIVLFTFKCCHNPSQILQ